MTDGHPVHEEFPKKQKEDHICPNATSCRELYHCKHAKPHVVDDACKLACGLNLVPACIEIPVLWLDKGGDANAEIKD